MSAEKQLAAGNTDLCYWRMADKQRRKDKILCSKTKKKGKLQFPDAKGKEGGDLAAKSTAQLFALWKASKIL